MATKGDKSPVFIDTNILIRFTLKTAPSHQEVRAAINRLWSDGIDLWISRQVLRELASVLTRPQTYAVPLSSVAAAQEIRAIPSSFYIADETEPVTANLLALMETIPMGGKQIHDANIAATMQVYGINRLLTLNSADFVRFSNTITLLTLEDILKPDSE